MNPMRMIAVASLTGLLAACGGGGGSAHSQASTLATVRREIAASLDAIAAALRTAAATVATTGIASDLSRPALRAACTGHVGAIDCSTIDPAGILRLVEPAAYRWLEGTDVSGQAAVRTLLETGQPVFGNEAVGAEGVPAVMFGEPVTPGGSGLAGGVTMQVSAAALNDAIIAPAVEGTPLKSWVMQRDGLIVYETDPTQIGLNLFTDPLYQPYPELIALGERIAAEPRGVGYYSFLIHGTDTVVKKKAMWDTVALADNEWRVVVYRVVH